MRNSSRCVGSAVALPFLCLVAGCAGVGRSYDEIDPVAAQEDVRKHNGYYTLRSVTPGTAKLILRSEGHGAARFSINTSGDDCGNQEDLGRVSDFGRGKLLPAVSAFFESVQIGRKTVAFVARDVPPGKPVLMTASGSWIDKDASGSCGPVRGKFKPAADRAYVAAFIWKDGFCYLSIQDATDPDSPKSIRSEPIASCKNP